MASSRILTSENTGRLLLLILVSLYLLAVWPLVASIGITPLLQVAHWFDPIFFLYNLALLLMAILIVPFITFFYVHTMKSEKARRLERDVPQEIWQACEKEICQLLNRQVRFEKYLGGMLLTMLVITVGVSALLLLKPMPVLGPTETGLDYSRGANILVLGPFLNGYPSERTYQRLLISLSAFQFGFLGAYIYFIGQLARSYFTLDLTPSTFIDSTIRMITASILALVVSFALIRPAENGWGLNYLPVASFFFGLFPKRAILVIEKIATRAVAWIFTRLPGPDDKTLPLSSLTGMSYAHELRLEREGLDTVENLSHANALELAVRTGFSYRQLRDWIDQAWLCAHLREHFDDFVGQTGLTSHRELAQFLSTRTGADRDAAIDRLAGGDQTLRVKLEAVCSLLSQNDTKPGGDHEVCV